MIPVLGPAAIHEADAWTIAHEPISSLALMERASVQCANRILRHHCSERFGPPSTTCYVVLAGMGNNGGDGLCIARLLKAEGIPVRVLRIMHKPVGSVDQEESRRRAIEGGVSITELTEAQHEFTIEAGEVVIDALFGSGLANGITGWVADVVEAVNTSAHTVLAIDIPSGLSAEGEPMEGAVVHADITFSLHLPKLAFFLPEHAHAVGEWELVPIGLDAEFQRALPTPYRVVEELDVAVMLRPRLKFSHKGDHGHALIIAGSKGRMGACVLTTRAALRSGGGLVTAHVPGCGLVVLQTNAPEAMCSVDANDEVISALPSVDRSTAVGIGPGLGISMEATAVVKSLIQATAVPCVFDADALNVLAENPTWLAFLPQGSILTPHPKEFDRLLGKPSATGYERLQRARELAQRCRCHIVLKGAHSATCTPNGEVYFNTTGNPGMAKGGSGDALTGVITALLAQGYSALEACLIGVHVHGLAGDLAATDRGMDGMIAGDLIDRLPAAWQRLRGLQNKPSTEPLP